MDSPFFFIALGAALGGFVQGLSGFAFGMTAMSVWAWTLEPALAAALSVFGSLTGQVIAAVTVRRGFDLRRLWPFLAGGVAGIPLGLWLLARVDQTLFRCLLGGLLVVWCPAMLFAARLPRIPDAGRGADGAVGVLGGAMGALGGFTGTIPTLWCTLRGLPKDAQRSIVQNFNLAMLAVTFVVYLGRGLATVQMLPQFGIVAAAMAVPVLMGGRLYTGLSDLAFRRIVLGLLTCSGIALLVASLPVLLARAGG